MFSPPRNLHRTKVGIIVTWYGSIIVASSSKKKNPWPLNFSRAKVKPTSELVKSYPTIVAKVIMQLLMMNCPHGSMSQGIR